MECHTGGGLDPPTPEKEPCPGGSPSALVDPSPPLLQPANHQGLVPPPPPPPPPRVSSALPPPPLVQKVVQWSMNPKSITYGELYGEINSFTGEWKDGVCAILAKLAVADTTSDMKWILFDGPVDTLWIESMNSVLDDSKLLCLDNGVRIKLPDTVRMMFEVCGRPQGSF